MQANIQTHKFIQLQSLLQFIVLRVLSIHEFIFLKYNSYSMNWFRKHLANIIFIFCIALVTMKWWISGSNVWAVVLIILFYIVGFGVKNQNID